MKFNWSGEHSLIERRTILFRSRFILVSVYWARKSTTSNMKSVVSTNESSVKIATMWYVAGDWRLILFANFANAQSLILMLFFPLRSFFFSTINRSVKKASIDVNELGNVEFYAGQLGWLDSWLILNLNKSRSLSIWLNKNAIFQKKLKQNFTLL